MADDTKETLYSDTEHIERAYQTSEVASMLGLAVPTIRKYSQILESKGYVFLKGKGTGQHQARLFIESDVTALRYLKDIREKSNMTVDQATSIVIERFGKGAIQPIRSNDIQHIDDSDKRYNELKELIQQQSELIQDLSDKVDKQQEHINERLKERDRLLMQSINEMLDSKKQIEAPTEKKGFFSRLFNK